MSEQMAAPASISGSLRAGDGWRLAVCWMLVGVWGACLVVTSVWPVAAMASAAEDLKALAFLLCVALHASLSYRWLGTGAFFVIVYVVAFVFEALSIATGFPFGFYEHGPSFGMQVLRVPLMVPLVYVLLGWFAWTLACIIVRERPTQRGGATRVVTPLAAAFILTGFDFVYDPIGSAALGLWVYRDPSGYFGVPLTNFLGWLLTSWVAFQLFALVEERFIRTAGVERIGYWLLPCVIWTAIALQYPFLYARASAGTVTVGGGTFVISDIYEAAVAAGLLTMLFVSLVAVSRLLVAREHRAGPV